jgi:anhydro-N-acetylmuramic acid kinase
MTGITTVADFRPRDVAAGGQGAPLVPAVDHLLFADRHEGRILLNIGGISNLTALPAGADPGVTMGFDTGPGNMLIDGAVSRLTGGRLAFDRDNEIGASGHIDQSLLQALLTEPYYRLAPPKSTGRELFGPGYLDGCLARARARGLDDASVVATLTALTAGTIADAIEHLVLPNGTFAVVIAAGGGVHNPLLMRLLRERLTGMGLALTTTERYGVHPDAKEAVAFGVLAYLTLQGRPGNVPSVTGAAMPLVLGSISPGHGWQGWPAGEVGGRRPGRREV